jgi:hypothetical protein
MGKPIKFNWINLEVYTIENPLLNANVPQVEEKPTHYLNLHLVDQEGNKYRVNMGIPLGGKYEKALSPSLIKAWTADSDKEFTLVGTINSAATKVVGEDVAF